MTKEQLKDIMKIGIPSEELYHEVCDELMRYKDLEEFRCPLDVIFKALRNGVYHTYYKSLFSRRKFQKLEVCLEYKYGEYLLTPTHKANFSLYLSDYKKTWWLKEDKSE